MNRSIRKRGAPEAQLKNQQFASNMKRIQQTFLSARPLALAWLNSYRRFRSLLVAAAAIALNPVTVFAQGFNSTELKTGISNSLAVIMLFGFVLGIAAVIAGGFAIRRGDVDTGKLSIIGGAIIAAAPAIAFAFFKIFGLDANATVGVGGF
jgi:hypothetical protein